LTSRVNLTYPNNGSLQLEFDFKTV